MQYLFQAPVDTSIYMIAGYTVIFGGMLIYLISLLVRRHNLMRNLETLRQDRKEIA